MSEFLLELYSEEVPPNLQINARKEIEEKIKKSLKDESVKYSDIKSFSSPTRLIIFIKGLKESVSIPSKEIRGPKVGVLDDIKNNFLKAHELSIKDIYEKQTEKGKFFFAKTKARKILVSEILIKVILNCIASLNWKKSMKWGSHDLLWGRPLRSILSLFGGKVLHFNFAHLKANDFTIIEKDLKTKTSKIRDFRDYQKFLRKNDIIFDQSQRENKIITKFNVFCSSRNFKNQFEKKLIIEVTNIVEDPHVILVEFSKKYLELPPEIIISTLQNQQRYFPIFDKKTDKLTNYFFVVSNKKDKGGLIKDGNKRVVEARLADAKFFWDKDKSKNLIKQIAKLKNIVFYESLGTIFDKTQRIRKLSALLADNLNLNKEKVEVAASISKSDLCSDLVGEYPDLQGLMGKHFAISQGFEDEVSTAVSDHYLPLGINSKVPKKPISYTVSIADKIDTLVCFFSINEKPTSSKDPFALRRSAIGLLRTIIENKLNIKIQDLISYNIHLLKDQNVIIKNDKAEGDLLTFLKDRMKNILKDKNIKSDIIEASLSSHRGDNYLDLYKKNILMNKYIDKEIGINAISSYKRAFNIIDKDGKEAEGRPDAVLFRKDEEKNLFEKINEIRKALTVKEDNKNYENLLKNLSETKSVTDSFFDNVVVNDENKDIKNNRIELLKMFCNTFNNFINFSKLEGL